MEFSSHIPALLADVAVRSLILAAAALAVIYLFRVRSAAARHAVWTAVTAGMLLLPALSPLVPSIPLRILRSAPVMRPEPAVPYVRAAGPPDITHTAPPLPARTFSWRQVIAAIYFAGLVACLSLLASSYRFTRRLVRASLPVELAGNVRESNWITVPVTVGFLDPKILLPARWREWPAEKLAAVMTHERTHVRRADWAIAVMAGINRCVFWFHPLAWWLERHLASLAEQACDDAALLELGARESYAEALLDMAATVKAGRGRMVWEAMAMAKTAEVRKRIDRILDETRPIPRGLTRSRWAALVVCSLPLIYVAAVMQLAPRLAPAQSASLTPQAVRMLETRLHTNPEDLAARGQLIASYYLAGVSHPRLEHIFWLIEHHPESSLAAFYSAAIQPGNTRADYDKAASLWRQQTATHTDDATVLGNAAQFFAQLGGDPDEAERLLHQAAALEPQNDVWTYRLAKLYASAIIAGAGYPDANAVAINPAFAAHAKDVVERSTGELRWAAGSELSLQSIRPDLQRAAILARYPQLEPVATLSRELTFGPKSLADAGASALPTPAASARLAVNLDGSILQKVNPVYPEQARLAGVEGDVRLKVNIGTDGRVQSAEPIEGNPLLAPAAQEAVMQYVYQPYSLDGTPREVETMVRVPFRLDAAASASLPVLGFHATGFRTVPSFLTRETADYTEEARKAKLEGNVTLALTFGADGKTHDIRVVKALGLGLDENAVEAAQKWTFQPAHQDGEPVDYPTTVTVPFHLAPPPPITMTIARKTNDGPRDERQVTYTPDPGIVATTRSFFIVSPGPGVTGPVLVTKVEPEYSEMARNARYQGTVTLSLSIGADGKIQGVRVMKSMGLGQDEKTLEAVKQWKFLPAYENGVAVPSTAMVQVEFRLM